MKALIDIKKREKRGRVGGERKHGRLEPQITKKHLDLISSRRSDIEAYHVKGH